ncbi:MAG TPA: FAD binding domain-containing protein [Polyangiales bacterium]|nr:FAD binding domain-containing protein [Polyangiales bacterium]
MALRFVLNGKAVQVDHIDPHVTLLQWLRGAGLTGTKEGCAEGECGACAVAFVAPDGSAKARLMPVNSCLVPLPACHGQQLISVEGVAAPSGELHPVQVAMVERGGSQCGYCTPGFVVSLFCEYYRRERGGYDPEAISGNLCRCTGYRPISDVARAMRMPEPSDPRLALLDAAPPALPPLTHAAEGSEFVRPGGLPELFSVWQAQKDAVLLGGGTDLMVYANQRHERFATLIALDAIPELHGFSVSTDEIVLGAGLSLSQVEERLHAAGMRVPMLAQLFPLFSSRLIRNRATLGGNLGTASPIGDSPPALLALDAELTLQSPRGLRRLPLREFFRGYRQTVLGPHELIVSIHIRLPLPRIQRFYKISKRVLDDISTVAAAFALDLTPDDRISRLRIAYGGVAATPLRALAVEQAATGRTWNQETCAQLAADLGQLGSPLTDHRGSAEYRRAMLGRSFEKFFVESRPGAAEAAQ